MTRRRWFRRAEGASGVAPSAPVPSPPGPVVELPPEPVVLADGAEGRVSVAPHVRLWYRVAGAGERIVVVPGTGNDRELERLVTPDTQVLFFDVRARGRSEGAPAPDGMGFTGAVRDLEAVRAAFGIERCSIVASTYLAGVAATYALEHPERVERLVLSSAVPPHAMAHLPAVPEPPPHHLAHLDQLVASGMRDRDPAAFCSSWREVYVPPLLADPAHYDRLAPVCDLPNEWPWNVARNLVYVYAELQAYDWRPQLRELAAPTLVVHGGADHDPVDVARAWVDALPDARLLELDSVGRFPWIEDPAGFFRTVNRFLAGEHV